LKEQINGRVTNIKLRGYPKGYEQLFKPVFLLKPTSWYFTTGRQCRGDYLQFPETDSYPKNF